MLLAVVLAISPRVGAAVVRAQERADGIDYVVGSFLTICRNYETALRISSEDMEVAIWVLERRKRGRYADAYRDRKSDVRAAK